MHSDWAVGNKVFSHHSGKLPVGRAPGHPLKASSFLGFLHVVLGVSLEVFPHRIHHHVVGAFDVFILFVFGFVLVLGLVLDSFSCHKHMMNRFALFLHVQVVQSTLAWQELDHSAWSVHLKHPPTVVAVVGYTML